MASNALTRLPPVILRMPSLKLLDISRNQISRLPEAISECQELAILIANSNRLTRLPRGIARLRKLIKLDVRSNALITLPINAQSPTYVNLTSFLCHDNPCLQYLTTLPGGDPEMDEYLGYRDLTNDSELTRQRMEDGWRREMVQIIGDFSGESPLSVWIDDTWADRVVVINNPHGVVERLDNSAKDTPPSLLEICLRTMKEYPKHILRELPTGLLRKLDDVACNCCECKCAMFTYCVVAFAHYHMERPSALPFCSLTCMRSFLGVQFDPDEPE